jgi:hypothetical protein
VNSAALPRASSIVLVLALYPVPPRPRLASVEFHAETRDRRASKAKVKPTAPRAERERRNRTSTTNIRRATLIILRAVPFSLLSSLRMASSDIYVQVTATSETSEKSRSVIVLVPRANIENFKREKNNRAPDDYSIAQSLAEPLARYAFTHRTIFSKFQISHSFSTTPPTEIEGKSPSLSQSGLKAWAI